VRLLATWYSTSLTARNTQHPPMWLKPEAVKCRLLNQEKFWRNESTDCDINLIEFKNNINLSD
jgi:hypothetical protein